jgi:hypothetical protein
MSSNNDITTTNTTNPVVQAYQLDDCVDKLSTYISKYIHWGGDDNKLNKIKLLFDENFKKFKNNFLHTFDNITTSVFTPNYPGASQIYPLDTLERADEIIEIMLSYDVKPRVGIFMWGYHTTHLESLELAFKHDVLPCDNIRYRQGAMNNALIHIILSERNSEQIIKAIDIFIKYGYNFNNYWVENVILWNPPVFKPFNISNA